MDSLNAIARKVLKIFKNILHFLKNVGAVDRYIFECSEIVYTRSFNEHLDSFIEHLEQLKDILDQLYVERTRRALNNETSLFMETNTSSSAINPHGKQDCHLLSSCQLSNESQNTYLDLGTSLVGKPNDTRAILDLNMSQFLQDPGIDGKVAVTSRGLLPEPSYHHHLIMDPTNKPLSELIDSISESAAHNSQFEGHSRTKDPQSDMTVDGPADMLLSADISQNAVSRRLDCLSDSETHINVSPVNQLTKQTLDELLEPLPQINTNATPHQPKLYPDDGTGDNGGGFMTYVENLVDQVELRGSHGKGGIDKPQTDGMFVDHENVDLDICTGIQTTDVGSRVPDKNSWNEVCNQINETSPKRKSFNCSTCGKVVSSKRNLSNHMRIHSGRKTFCCEHCGKLFTTKQNLRAHLTRQHNLNTETALSCSECGKLFTRKSALDIHLARHRGIKPFSCYECGKCFTQKVTRDIHVLTHTGKYEYTCYLCSKVFATKSRLKFHMASHSEPKFSCTLCSKKFSNKQYLNKHYETHNVTHNQATQCLFETAPDKPTTQVCQSEDLFCGQCDLAFRSKRGLTKHRKTKHGSGEGPRFHCTVLDCKAQVRSFSTKQYLKKHNNRHHNPNRERFSCSVCTADFADQTSLSHHMNTKHSTIPAPLHRCSMCSKTFTLSSKLKAHVRTHTEEPHLRCEICGKSYYRSDNLKKHMLSHMNAGISCSICGKRMLHESSLKNHMKKHEGSVYTCSQCNKTFTTKGALEYHIDNHNEKFRFSCGSCGKQFVRKVHYESHLKTHTDERPFKCPTCDRAFKEQKHWKEHIKRVHRSEFPHKTAPHQMSLPEPQQATTSTHFETLEEIIDSSTQVSSDLFVVWFLLHGVPCTVYVLVGICLKLKYAIYFMLLEDFSFVCIQSYCCILLGLKQPDPYGEYLPINPIILFLVLWQNNSVHA